MPLQNRVDPFGEVHAIPERGMFTGNRGVIHDPATKTLLRRRWTTKAWIICQCQYKDHRRVVMGRNARSGNAGWTELFFLDEVTALAAGHRPCFYCRRKQARDFMACFAASFGLKNPKAGDVDAMLHESRLASGGVAVSLAESDMADLPDGAMIAAGHAALAKRGDGFLPWHFSGYGAPVDPVRLVRDVRLITPHITLAALRSGYKPVWHATASS